MWDFFETVRHRHTIRKYQSNMPVEDEKLHAILETATSAPSMGNLQAYRIFVVKDEETKTQLKAAANHQAFVSDAPLVLVFCADIERSKAEYGQRGAELYAIQDATIAASYCQLAAVAAGLASTWIGEFDTDAVNEAIGMEVPGTPVALVTVGYPAEVPEPTPRTLSDIVTYV